MSTATVPPNAHAEQVREMVERRRRPGVVEAPQRIIPILTPTLGMVSAWWHSAILDIVWPMNTGKACICVPDRKGGEIAEMRNRLVSMMLATETERQKVHSLFWLDDDVIIGRACLLKLAAHDRDIVSGVYFSKGDIPCPLLFGGPCSGTEPFRPNEEFECWGWSNGLSLVKIEVYKRMRDELDIGVDKYGAPNWYEAADFRIQDNGQPRIGGTEDFPFFEKANKLGICPLIDCSRFTFGFHFDGGRQIGYPLPQWEQFERGQPIVWPATSHHEEVIWEGLA
jgi:hypothetical protein